MPVWLIILSDQLPVVALVGRYPTNQLIGRNPLLKQTSFYSQHDAAIGDHPVLLPVSKGYPRLEGRLLTCYSTVRRYPEG